MTQQLHDDLTGYLKDAHSIEEQALQQLERAPKVAGEETLARALEEHRLETEGHESRVRQLLEERGEKPSRLKDAVMKAGGTGFVLFAESQTDTPGKLASHALSYEALEWASYDLLARTAERAGENRVAEVARAIRAEEKAMMERIEGLFERTARASLEKTATDDVREHLRRYLADAHALEAQSIQLLESGRGMAEDTALAAVFDEHLHESRRQQERLEERLDALDGKPSMIKDAALRLGAMNWGMFFGAQPDTPAKLAAFAYAVEYLEVGGYEQLRVVAREAGDAGTVRVAGEILAEERRAAERVAGVFDQALTAALAAD